MFDAKDLLEWLVKGAQGGGASRNNPTGGDLGTILGQLLPGAGANAGDTKGGSGGLGDLEGMLKNVLGGSNAGATKSGKTTGSDQTSGGGLGDIGEILGQVLGQATSGVKEGAGKINDATGAGNILNDLVAKYGGGRSAEEIVDHVKKLMDENKLGTGAALGGLGALILGTQTGRSVAMSAAKIGALALIGGLAYKAYENHQAGRPLIATGVGPEPAPSGSGFEADAVSNDDAVLYIRAMIAAAAADGRIDAKEQQTLLSSLSQSGMDASAEEFLASEMNNPASIGDLASGIATPQQAVQVYTAARIAIEPDTRGESQFLTDLAARLRIDNDLAAQINAAARNLA